MNTQRTTYLQKALWKDQVIAALSSAHSIRLVPGLCLLLVFTLASAVQVFAQAAPGHLIKLKNYPDLSATQQMRSKEEKGAYVYAQIQAYAQNHEGLLKSLRQTGAQLRPYWLAGAVHVEGLSSDELRHWAGHPQVESIKERRQGDASAKQELPQINPYSPDLEAKSNAATPDWGIRFMDIPELWAQGITGQGVVIAGQDTGYDWDHPALMSSYRGWLGDRAEHDYSWHDAIHSPVPATADSLNPCGYSRQSPCDDHGHGTHTMGTMAGVDAGGPIVGGAPGAKWIGCRNMDRGNGNELTYLECFEWFLAPTRLDGSEPRPDLAPDVINNSWSCPLSEGCDSSTYFMYERAVASLRAAGIVVVASAGNSGRSGCATVVDVPVVAPGTLIVGAHDSLGRIASFSSRGFEDGLGRSARGPMVAAPGVAVLSARPGVGYGLLSGTSMAGPHVGALVALIISANPMLRGQVEEIEAIIRRSAVPQMPPVEDVCTYDDYLVPNPVFGYGWVNALRAVEDASRFYFFVLDDETAHAGFSLQPNPVYDHLRIEMEEVWEDASLEIFDLAGRSMLQISLEQRVIELHHIDWPAGVYTYRLMAGKGQRSGKLIKM